MLTLGLNLGQVTHTRGQGGGFDLRGYLSSLSDGFLFDYTDPDWMFQEPTGPTAVAATNDVIGLALSRRLAGQGGTLAGFLANQPELWNDALVGFGPNSSRVGVNDYRIFSPDGTDTAVALGGALVIGRTYLVTFEMYDVVSGSIRVGNPPAAAFSTPGFKQFLFRTTDPDALIKRNVTCDIKIRNVSFKEVSRAAATQAILGQRLKFGGPAGASCDALDDNHLTTYLIGSGDEFLLAKITVPASLPGSQMVMGKADSSFSSNLFWGFAANGQIRYNAANMATTQAGPDFRGQTIVAGITCGPAGFRVFANGEEVVSGVISGSAAGPTPVRIGAFNNAGAATSFFGGNILKAVGGRDRLDLARFRQIASQL